MKGKFDEIADSREYKEKLSATLVSLLAKTKAATTEASVASAIETELACFIKMVLGVDIIFEKEVGQTDLKHRRREFTGRLDAISNDLVIEYKAPRRLVSEKDQDKATKQVEGYLMQLKEERNIDYAAILTDGQKIRYFYYLERELHHTPFKALGVEDLDKIVCGLINVDNKKFVPENIINDFKLNAKKPVTLNLAKCLFNIITNNISDKTDMLFQEWQELFHLSENDSGQNLDIEKRKEVLGKLFNKKIVDNEMDYKALFVLQTTYAIIVKLIACKVISRLSNDKQGNIVYFSDLSSTDSEQLREFMENLEEGYTFAIGGIRNLLEGDFFSWYAAENQWNSDEEGCIKDIILTLEAYADSSFSYGYTAIDIFKDLYMEIMPNEVRHSLGEYFTPAWLADYVIDNSKSMITAKKWRAIDPCCGSGIFVVTLIKHIIRGRDIISLSEAEKKELLHEILDRVQGIDINPLSVLTARVSYLLAISPLLGNEQIEIPIYLGDSANIPSKVEIEGVTCYQYCVVTKQGEIDITLPCSFVESKSFLERMSLLQTIIKNEDKELVLNKLKSYVNAEDLKTGVLERIEKLSERLVDLHRHQWDGIWLRIVTNYMLIARIGNIDMIVGNPPWVKWEFLPQVYAEKIKKLCLARHLFSGQTYMGAISLNICALISNVTAAAWLNANGILAFLMPKTLMTQDSYAGFRNFYINPNKEERMFLQKVDDWSKAGNPFVYTTEKFLTYYYMKTYVDYSKGIPIKYIIKDLKAEISRINTHDTYRNVEEMFKVREGRAFQLDTKRTGFTMLDSERLDKAELYSMIVGKCDYKARSGVEFTPAEVYFIEPVEAGGEEGKYKFCNSQFANSVYKAKGKFILETEYIKPVLKSPCIREFGISDNNNYCIFPYKNGESICVELEELCETNECLAKYLILNRKKIEKQSKRSKMIARGKEFYALSKVGAYTFGEHAVAFRDNTKLVATVLSEVVTPWGDKSMPICAKHSPYISMDKNDRYITENEAYYICGILNTNIVQEYFRATYSGRSYSIDFNIKIPLYDNNNEIQREIAGLSKEAKEVFYDTDRIQDIKQCIEECYINLCRNSL